MLKHARLSGNRAGRVVGARRLGAKHRALTIGCQQTAGQQTAATDRHDHGLQIRYLFQEFQSGRALPGDDPGIVIGRDFHSAATGDQVGDTLFAGQLGRGAGL